MLERGDFMAWMLGFPGNRKTQPRPPVRVRVEKAVRMSSDSKAPAEGKGPQPAPGDGIRSMKTSTAFRALNFELYAKPNKTVMRIGVASIVLAVGYLAYINYAHYDREKYYYATNMDDSISARKKVSRWDS